MPPSAQEKEAQSYGIGAPYLDQLRMVLPYKFHTAKEPEHSYSVPRIAHFVWHSSVAPDYARQNIAKFAQLNPTYRTILWTDVAQPNAPCEIQQISQLSLFNRNIVASFAPSRGVYSDLLRYEIVFAFGGVYLDCDIEVTKPMDTDIFTQAFVCPELTTYFGITNASFGFTRASSFVKYVLQCVQENVSARQPQNVIELSGPVFLTSCVKQYDDSNIIGVPQQIFGNICRQPDDKRPIWAIHYLKAEWQKRSDNLCKYYEQLFHDDIQCHTTIKRA